MFIVQRYDGEVVAGATHYNITQVKNDVYSKRPFFPSAFAFAVSSFLRA